MDVSARKCAGQGTSCPLADIPVVGNPVVPANNDNKYSDLGPRPPGPAPSADSDANGYGLRGSAEPESIQTP
jgi:hypothetical protein